MFNSWGNIVLFLFSGTSAVVGNALLKAGMNHQKTLNFSLSNIPQLITSLVTNWQIALGFILYGASSVLYLKLLANVDVTKAYPALVAYMAIVILLIGAVFLKEPLNLVKVVAAGIIVFGIFLLNKS